WRSDDVAQFHRPFCAWREATQPDELMQLLIFDRPYTQAVHLLIANPSFEPSLHFLACPLVPRHPRHSGLIAQKSVNSIEVVCIQRSKEQALGGYRYERHVAHSTARRR